MGITPLSDEDLKQTIKDVEKYGSCGKAAKALGINRRTVERRMIKARERFDYGIPQGQILAGVSKYESYIDDRGKEAKRWVKTSAEQQETQALVQAMLEGILAEIKPQKPIKPPPEQLGNLLVEYNLTDYHLGALADAQESGADWNIDISEDLVRKWLLSAMASMPDTHTAVLNQMGDFQHFSSMLPVTPASGHILDAAARPHLIVRAAIRIMRMLIDSLLTKHSHVHIKVCDANHDPYGQLFLREMLKALYEKEPRVEIDDSPSIYYVYEWGDVSLFYHHGHKKNLKEVSEVFVGTFREIYGRTKFSYGRIGHFHHGASTEDCLMKTEIMPTLSPKDNHAAQGGYLSKREAVTVLFHKKYGEVKRITTSPEMVL